MIRRMHPSTSPSGVTEDLNWLQRGNWLYLQLKHNPHSNDAHIKQRQLTAIFNDNFQRASGAAEKEAIREWAILLTKLTTPPTPNTSNTVATTVATTIETVRSSSTAAVTASRTPRQHAKPRTQNEPVRAKQPAMSSTISMKPDAIGPKSYAPINPDGLYESIMRILSHRFPDYTISQQQENSLHLLSNNFAAAKDIKDMRLAVETMAVIVRKRALPSSVGTLLITIAGTTKDLPDSDRSVLHDAFLTAIDKPLANDEEIDDLDA